MIELKLKELIIQAMKTKDTVTKDVLRVALGQIQTESSNGVMAEDQKVNVVRKLIKSNQQTLDGMNEKDSSTWSNEWHESQMKLVMEMEVLRKLLPTVLNEVETRDYLIKQGVELKSAKSDGQAIGTAMKAFKASGVAVDSTVVKQVVEGLRK